MRQNPTIVQLTKIACCVLAAAPFAHAQAYVTTVPPNTELYLADSCYTTVTTTVSPETVVNSIHIKNADDVGRLRKTLISQIWGTETLPTGIKASVVQTIPPHGSSPGNLDSNASALYGGLSAASIATPATPSMPSNLGAEYRLTWNLLTSPAISSIMFEWTPKVSNGRLFIVHDGHSDDDYDKTTGAVTGKALNNLPNQMTVNLLLELGYTVVWIQMPLYG